VSARDRPRLDVLVVERGLCPTREKAQAVILAGQVRVDGVRCDKPGTRIRAESLVEVMAGLRFVSRGGDKLDAALDRFGVDPTGLVALDVGASTGGFTDCLLQRGARRVHAVDVGRGIIDAKLRNDHRVHLVEETNARYLRAETTGEPVDLVVMDLSFISLRLVLPAIPSLLRAGSEVVALVKPQFEVGKGEVGKRGVVREPALHRAVLERVAAGATALGCGVRGITPSPLLGPMGNREFLMHLTSDAAGDVAALVAQALAGVTD